MNKEPKRINEQKIPDWNSVLTSTANYLHNYFVEGK